MGAPFRLADERFDSLADPEEMCSFIRGCLPDQIDGVKQVLLLACMDKAKMVDFLEKLGREDGDAAMVDLFDQIQHTSEWLANVGEVASSVSARVMIGLHQIADMPAEEIGDDDVVREPLATAA